MSRKRVYLENYGCPANRFDLEVMAASLQKSGHSIVEDLKSADVLVINTCAVKKPTQDKIIHRLCFLRNLGKLIVVTGCLTKVDSEAIEKAVPDYLALLDPSSANRIAYAVEGDIRGRQYFSDKPVIKVESCKPREGRVFEIVPISEGCLGSCAFCCTRVARGRLFSYPVDKIVERVEWLVRKEVKEIWITAQDIGAYGLDSGYDLTVLLEKMCGIEGEFFLRVGMMNPNHALRMLDSLIKTYKNDKVFKFVHLPVQSGNDRVLRLMNRAYTANDFKRIVNAFRKEIPDITVSTDIICGFPGEDEEAFEDSIKLVKEAEPDVVNVSKFTPRPKTAATKMKQLPSQIVKARSEKMAALSKEISLKRNMRWLGWEGNILVDEEGTGSSMIGRNFAYKPVVVDAERALLGERINVKIREAATTYLKGSII